MEISAVVSRLKRIMASPKFFYVTLGFIVASCLMFILSISYQIPPDEHFHFRFIEFYADRPISDGPFITNQGYDYFDLRDITRTPNYLYHYFMSFVLKATRLASDSLFAQVVVLRLINLGLGVVSLLVVRRILRQVKTSPFIQNSVLFLLSLTGMLLWIFSSVNYDVASMLLYLLCLSTSLSILQGKGISVRRALLYATFGMLCVLIKVTFLPFLAILTLVTLLIKRRDMRIVQDFNLYKAAHIVILVVMLVTGFLFVERIGGNIINYRQIEVSCDKVHDYQSCMQDDVFNRNETQLKAYARQKADGRGVTYQPYQFSQMWSAFMYERSHFYYGHEQMRANYGAKIMAVATAFTFVGLAVVFRHRIAETTGERLLLWTTASYALVIYIFNAQTWLKFGQPYAFQGRYLFPVIPFLYYFCVKLLILTYRRLAGRWRQSFLVVLAAVALLSIYTHLPLLVFYRGTEAKWYSNPTIDFHREVQDSLKLINIKPLI